MIDGIRSWLLSVAAASVCLAVFYAVLPKGTVRSIARVSGGLVLLCVMLQPLAEWDVALLQESYRGYQEETDRQIAAYRQSYLQELEARIQEETAAYISDKAAQMGLECHAEVVTQQEGDVPIPTEVILNISKNAALSEWIAREVGIEESEQHWEEMP